jgi:alpha-beta hydrolase superfamily lysophospholipase
VTLEALARAVAQADAGPAFDLPVFWVHGTDDELVPLELAAPAVRRLAGADLEEHVRQGARHEVLNELDKDEVLAALGAFVERVSAA